MESKRRQIALGFSDAKVSEGQHICYVYNDDRERIRVVAKFLESGLLDREKVLYYVDAMTPAEMLDNLEHMGIDARSLGEQFAMNSAATAYCPNGTFHPDAMLELTKKFYTHALEEGYSGARGAGDMSWCLGNGWGTYADLMSYEARLTHVLEEYPYTACCQYDARRFDGKTIMDILAVHPVMIVRGQLVKNPYYVPAESFLGESSRQQGN